MSDRDPSAPTPLPGHGLPLPRRATGYLLRRILTTRGRQRRAHLRDLGFRALARATPSLVVEDRGTRIHLRADDDGVSRLVWIFGLYDEALLQRALELLEALGRPRALAGRTFLDVGANIGTSTLAAMRLGAGAAVAVEPHPQNVRTLRLNVIENDLADRARVVHAAAGAAEGTATLEVDPENSGDHRVRVDGASAGGAFGEAERETIEVPAVTVDSLGLSPAEVGLAWIDTQGHEARVLEGGRELFADGVPIVLEYWPYGLRAAGDLDRLHALIAERGGFVDLREPFGAGGEPRVRRGEDAAALVPAYAAPGDHTELLVLPR